MGCTVSGVSDDIFKSNERKVTVDFIDKIFMKTHLLVAFGNLAMLKNIDKQTSYLIFGCLAVKPSFL